MITVALVTILCTAGIAFYLRFLIALYRESKHAEIGYVIELDIDDNDRYASTEKKWDRLGMSTLEVN